LTTPKILGGLTFPSVFEGGSATPACFELAESLSKSMLWVVQNYPIFLIVLFRNLFYILLNHLNIIPTLFSSIFIIVSLVRKNNKKKKKSHITKGA
jgi:hypothetical protein